MVSSADKTIKFSPAIQQKAAGASFFRKAGGQGFFGAKENPSFFGKPVQAKLTVSTADDPHEKEADAVADKVMRMQEPVMASPLAENKEKNLDRKEEEEVQAKSESPVISKIPCKGNPPQVQAKSENIVHRSEEKHVDAKHERRAPHNGDQTIGRKNISLYQSDIMRQSGRGPPASSIPFEQTLSSSKGGGSALPGSTQIFMESRFNADFSGVRIHTDNTAQHLSSSVNAQAFAHGNDIYFNSGKFSPNTTEGGTLLAHELTHTIQQGASKTNTAQTSIAKKTNRCLNKPDSKLLQNKAAEASTKTALVQPQHTLKNWPADAKKDIAPGAENSIDQKQEKDKLATKEQLPVLPAKVTLSEAAVKPATIAAKALQTIINTAVQPKNRLQQKTEETIQEKENQSSEKEPDVHIKQKTATACCKEMIARCGCNDHEGSAGIDAKLNISENHHTENTVSISNNSIAPDGRGPPLVSAISSETISRSPIDDALGYAGSVTDCVGVTMSLEQTITCAKGKAEQVAMHIPGYKALRVVLGEDPITGAPVAFNGRNFIEAAFDIMPGGELLHRKLDELHQLDGAAQWIDEKIVTIKGLVSSLTESIKRFFSGLGASDLLSPLDILKRGANIILGFINKVIDFAVTAGKQFLKMVKDFLLEKIVDFIKNQTTAYPLLTVILGKDPVTEKEVARNGTNILNALLELGGEEGKQQKKQMDETGTFKKAAGYIDEGIAVFSGAYEQITGAFHNIWNVVSIDSLMDPVGTFTKIYNEFAAPVQKVWDFIKRAGAEILKFIKDVLMIRLSTWAKTVKGYSLVTVIIGKDPFTGAAVPRTVENLIHGFMSLMDGGEEQFTQMKESGAIAKAEQKVNAAVKKLNMTPQAIIQLFTDLWNSFSIKDLVNPVAAFQRILAKFGEPIGRLLAFVIEIIKIVVEVILIIMQFPFDLINNIIAKAMQAYQKIKSDPIGFLKNLLRAIKEGFMQFFDNILKHLLAGLTGWLVSELKDANVKAPADFSLKTIIGWVLDLLGISMEKIWDKLAKHPKIGPERVAKMRGMIGKLEGIWTFIKDVQERGMAAIWDKIVEKLNNLWDTVLDAIKNWIMEQIVNKMVTKLLSMLDPTGIMAVVNSVIALYKAIQSFIKYLKQMLEIVNSFVEGVVEIANGNTKKAANFLEATLAKGVPIVIGFLANQVGLSGVGKKVGEMIEKVRDMVDKALTWLVNKAVDTGAALIDKLMGKRGGGEIYSPEKQAKVDAGLKALQLEQTKYLKSNKISKDDAVKIAATIKSNHPVFSSFTIEENGSKINFFYTASEKQKAGDDVEEEIVPDGTKQHPYQIYWPSLLSHPPVASNRELKKSASDERDTEDAYQIRQRERLFQTLAKDDAKNDSLTIVKQLRAKFGIKARITEYKLDVHFHHVHPLFLNGEESFENIIMLPINEHLSGHSKLRYQSGVSDAQLGLPTDKKDLYKHPNNTYYSVKGEI